MVSDDPNADLIGYSWIGSNGFTYTVLSSTGWSPTYLTVDCKTEEGDHVDTVTRATALVRQHKLSS